ncbi:hypothetical protein EIN_418480 [Entamoeba invadens IP1]|uniref:TLDc domain-containing protein n=1 Tax=Entamoeba invadens IP1 TaxID=370355 RepID=A0A0A1U1S0_ENTIV|nr:hypothetical protein EIN_418480 [Entamoeba invadens IP1]ELP87969.1 hypothetical protein EIN_418480 [Entamoeba invadens IP1]|eukprot:XP_004254740.1 hypothetical protein EIN_418480 [Entamoeba invadens IP1]
MTTVEYLESVLKELDLSCSRQIVFNPLVINFLRSLLMYVQEAKGGALPEHPTQEAPQPLQLQRNFQDQLASLKDELTQLIDQNTSTMNLRIVTMSDTMQGLYDKVNAIETQKLLNGILSGTNTEHTTKLNALDVQLEELKGKVSILTNSLLTLKTEMSTLKAPQDELTTLNNKCEALRVQLSQVTLKVDKLNQQNNDVIHENEVPKPLFGFNQEQPQNSSDVSTNEKTKQTTDTFKPNFQFTPTIKPSVVEKKGEPKSEQKVEKKEVNVGKLEENKMNAQNKTSPSYCDKVDEIDKTVKEQTNSQTVNKTQTNQIQQTQKKQNEQLEQKDDVTPQRKSTNQMNGSYTTNVQNQENCIEKTIEVKQMLPTTQVNAQEIVTLSQTGTLPKLQPFSDTVNSPQITAQLSGWCQGKVKLLFLSDERKIDSQHVNKKIHGKKGILVMCRSESGKVFGFFSGGKVPETTEMKGKSAFVKNDWKHFVFMFEGKNQIGTKFEKKDCGDTIVWNSIGSGVFVDCRDAFAIGENFVVVGRTAFEDKYFDAVSIETLVGSQRITLNDIAIFGVEGENDSKESVQEAQEPQQSTEVESRCTQEQQNEKQILPQTKSAKFEENKSVGNSIASEAEVQLHKKLQEIISSTREQTDLALFMNDKVVTALYLSWNNQRFSSLLYDSKENGMDPQRFSKFLSCIANTIIAVQTTSGLIFGIYNQTKAPQFSTRKATIEGDTNHFAFVFSTSKVGARFKTKSPPQVGFIGDMNDVMFQVGSSLIVFQDGRIVISDEFNKLYDGDMSNEEMVGGATEGLKLQRLVVMVTSTSEAVISRALSYKSSVIKQEKESERKEAEMARIQKEREEKARRQREEAERKRVEDEQMRVLEEAARKEEERRVQLETERKNKMAEEKRKQLAEEQRKVNEEKERQRVIEAEQRRKEKEDMEKVKAAEAEAKRITEEKERQEKEAAEQKRIEEERLNNERKQLEAAFIEQENERKRLEDERRRTEDLENEKREKEKFEKEKQKIERERLEKFATTPEDVLAKMEIDTKKQADKLMESSDGVEIIEGEESCSDSSSENYEICEMENSDDGAIVEENLSESGNDDTPENTSKPIIKEATDDSDEWKGGEKPKKEGYTGKEWLKMYKQGKDFMFNKTINSKDRIMTALANKKALRMLSGAIVFKMCKKIYDTTHNKFSTQAFNAAIAGKKSIMVIVQTEGCVFGCYNESDGLPRVVKRETPIIANKAFVFSLVNRLGEPFLVEKKTNSSFYLHNTDDNGIVSFDCCFTIKKDKKIYVQNKKWSECYNTKFDSGILTGATFPVVADMERLVVFEWN